MQRGIDGHKAIVSLFRRVFPDLQWRIEEMVAEGDRVVARTTMSGIHMLRVADGKLIEHWGNNDDPGMMQQLGVLPVPAAAGA